MVSRDLAGYHLQLMFHRYLPYHVAHTNRDLPRKHRLAVLRYPHQMNLKVALRVRSYSVMSHATKLHENLLRLKARGFNHPRWGH